MAIGTCVPILGFVESIPTAISSIRIKIVKSKKKT